MHRTGLRRWAHVSAAMLAAATALAAGTATAADGLEVTVGESGLTRLAWAGTELLKDGKPQVKRVVLERQGTDEQKLHTYTFERPDVAEPKVSFDRAGQRLTYGYAWGSVSFAYAPAADRLGITVTITNDSKLTIADFEIAPLILAFPAVPTKPQQGRWMETLPDRVGVVEAQFGGKKLLLCCDAPIALNFGLGAGGKLESPVVLAGGVHRMEPGGVTFSYLGLPRVKPGQSLAIPLSLRLSSAEACKLSPLEPPNDKMLADVYDSFRSLHQPRSVWKDRRPIGTIFVGTGKGPESNPRNWFGKPNLDVRTAEGKAELRKQFMALADRCIAVLKRTNAQGAVVWDPEGAENPHPITYIGDPRMVKVLAPEVEDIYPQFFKKFTDAGLRIGCCIRPTQVYFEEKSKKWDHGTGSHGLERNPLGDDFSSVWPAGVPWWRFYPVAERMCRKIEYARKNWGCTIFYVDTNGIFRQIGEKQEFKWGLLDSHIWRDISRKHPDVLLIPELSSGETAQWAYTAQYLQPPYSPAATPAYMAALLPGAFSVCQSVNLAPAAWDMRRAELLDGIRRGDSMFFRGWFDDGYNAKIKQMYDDVDKPDAPKPELPPTVPGAE